MFGGFTCRPGSPRCSWHSRSGRPRRRSPSPSIRPPTATRSARSSTASTSATPPRPPRLRWPVRRWGGNATTRYSWQDDIANHASDWFFYNIESTARTRRRCPTARPPTSSSTRPAPPAASRSLTVPLIGWTPIDRVAALGLLRRQVRRAAADRVHADRQRRPGATPDAGNGNHPDGTPITGNDPHDTSREIGPDVRHGLDGAHRRTGRHGGARAACASSRSTTSRRSGTRPTATSTRPPLTYDELWQRTRRLRRRRSRRRIPAALVLGPVRLGLVRLLLLGARTAAATAGPDLAGARRRATTSSWYLQQVARLRDSARRAPRRLPRRPLLPAGHRRRADRRRVSGDRGAAPALAQEPLRPDVRGRVLDRRLLRRRRRAHPADEGAGSPTRYPGTKLAITEYNWGNDDGISSALAQAEALAIFGREGVDLATRWVAPGGGQPRRGRVPPLPRLRRRRARSVAGRQRPRDELRRRRRRRLRRRGRGNALCTCSSSTRRPRPATPRSARRRR